MLELSGAFMAMTFAVFAVYGLFAASVRDRVIIAPEGDGLAAPQLCRRLCRARRQAGVRGAVKFRRRCDTGAMTERQHRLRNRDTARIEMKKAGLRPAISCHPELGARAELSAPPGPKIHFFFDFLAFFAFAFFAFFAFLAIVSSQGLMD